MEEREDARPLACPECERPFLNAVLLLQLRPESALFIGAKDLFHGSMPNKTKGQSDRPWDAESAIDMSDLWLFFSHALR